MTASQNIGVILTPAQFAEKFQVSERFLQHDRVTKRRIKFIKIGKFVRYREQDGIDFIAKNTVGGGMEGAQ